MMSQRVPTLAPLLEAAGRGLRRMPLTVVTAAVATVAAIVLNEDLGDARAVTAVLWSAILGIPLFTGLRLLAERYRWRPSLGWVAQGAGALLLVAFAVAWTGWTEAVQVGRAVQLMAVFGLFLAVAPYLTGPEGHGFWEYNRLLLERLLVAAVIAHVLYVGAAVALAALDNLFGVDVPPQAYLRLWCVAVLFLMPWFFVAGVPADWAALEREPAYPRGLRVFTRFVLLPIVALYLVILLAYFVKVLVTWQWPSGWIGWLVSAVAAAGIFSLLLVHPLAARPGNRWVGTYARGFYVFLLPAIVMLWLAIWQRVEQYGITENRYFLTVLSVWLAGVAGYQLATRARGIRVIPLSLGLVGLVTVAGPWGAYAISEGSQVGRLAGLLERNGMLVDGQVSPAAGAVPAADRREISAAIRYLAETHDLDRIAPWFGGRLAELDTLGAWPEAWRHASARARQITEWLGVEYVTAWQGAPSQWFSYTAAPGERPLVLAPYDSLLIVGHGPATRGPGLTAHAVQGGRAVEVYRDGTMVGRLRIDSLLAGLRAQPEGDRGRAPVPGERLRVTVDTADLRLTLQLYTVGGQWEADSLTVREFTGVVLVGRR